jgi:uncharacterized protein
MIEQTKNFVQQTLEGAEAGHDWFHIERVHRNALRIAKTEVCNTVVVELAALLHDIADSKFFNGDESIGPKMARTFLESHFLDYKTIDHVVAIIENISFKGGHQVRNHESIELDIVQDADRLDAIGAIGIARTFNFGGFKNRPLYDPSIKPKIGMSKEEYKKAAGPTLNHFYEKLLLLKDLMNTRSGKALAEQRHAFMEQFLDEFMREWNGKG